ncbi:MAG TPA: DUF4340 domain-containing protein [Fibrobacteria bacterium]|jgi:hypothetical protein|nr:DUF4340 domain-containing protein [Fibrobacteria bacterium]
MKKALVALLAAALVLGLVVAFMKWRDVFAARPHPVFTDTRFDNAASLTIRYLGDSVTLSPKEGRWVTSDDGFPADSTHLRRALGALASLEARETVADSAVGEDLVEYGLNPEETKRVEWKTTDGAIHRIQLGKLSGIDYGSLFWKKEGEAKVYRSPGTFIWDFSSRPVDWKDTNLFYPKAPFAPEDIRSIQVEWKSADSVSPALTTVSWRLERSGDSDYVLTAPDSPAARPALRADAAKMFLHASQFKIDFFVPGGDSLGGGAALEAPFMTIRIALKDGSERVVTAGSAVAMLYRYARYAAHPDPVRVFKWRFEYFKKRPEELTKK